ncbi:metallophosphoesterase [Halorientalis sp.]|uniref:metallophosphoesterase n=1 Tax=Halorientalis sp. TaxID=1931229 RepID=UPI00262B4C2D|nr:metallophosphoesterase [Halorientalis sp.]
MDVNYRDRAALLGSTLVCADLHVGKAAAANVSLPLGERDHLVDRVTTLCERHDPETVVFAGDLLHSFDQVATAAEETVTALGQTVRDAGARPVVTPGNHDTMLDVVWSGPTAHEFTVETDAGRVVVCHGHHEPETEADLYVVGHDHPTITVEGRKWHCYLYGHESYDGADVLVLPAFSHLIEGVSINRRYGGTATTNSPLIGDLDRFRPVVWDDEAETVREFPPLGEFRDLL